MDGSKRMRRRCCRWLRFWSLTTALILKHMLADVKIVAFNLVCAFSMARDQTGLNRQYPLDAQPAHDATNAFAAKAPHQVIFQG
jgi:hypothetical protein